MARAALLEPIATLPVFLKLRGRRAVLAGGGEPALWKAELLSAAGARLEVYEPDPHEALHALAAAPPDGPISIHARAWRPNDLAGAAIALGAIEDEEEAARFQAAARAVGVPVNVIDKPAFCDVQFGTLVSRSPLLIGISTDGAAPVFGQAIRARIEALLPDSLRHWASAARDWRESIQAEGFSFRARRRFWSTFAERALAEPGSSPTTLDRDACLAAALDESQAGHVTIALVGAGRGSPDGLTLQAIKALQDADCVFYGSQVSAQLVGFSRREAAKVAVDEGDLGAALAVVLADRKPGRYAWLDQGDPHRCLRWRARASALEDAGARVMLVEGLGRCSGCNPSCPAWAG